MPFLIDGHNLIGRMPEISLADPDDEARLVREIRRYCLRHRRRAVVVFDAGLFGGQSRALSTPEVEVVFASGKQSADDVIRGRLLRARDRRGWIVVSSDRGIQQTAQALGARVVSSETFAAMMRGEFSKAEGPPGEEKETAALTEAEIREWLDLFSRRGKA